MAMSKEERVLRVIPDLTRPHLFDEMVADLAEHSGDFLVMPSG